jgi:hypothetical protein
MGPSSWRNRLSLFTLNSLPSAILICGLLLGAHPGFAQANAAAPAADSGDLQGSTSPSSKADEQKTNFPAVGNISGTVLDATGVALPGAEVKLTGRPGMPVTMVKTAENGWFSFGEIAPGPFELDIELTGFKTKTVMGTLPPSEGYLVPAITLDLAPVVTEVSVRLTTEQIATEQIKEQEQQRIIAVIPNFYTSYVHDAVSLTTKQKFALAWRYSIDPANIVIAAMIAGGEQADDAFAGYGQGAAGYARRFGAAYGDAFIGTFVSSAILPSILKQDPRYFYKGTGTVKSRILYAISRSVITKGDNGGWQPDYSGIGGALVSGAISNLYYPEGSQHGFDTVLTNTLIGIGTSAGVNILQEFVFPKLTPKFPKNVPGLPKHDKPSS